MRDATLFRRQAMHAYQVGRMRFAARVAVVIVPLTLLCAWETRAFVECAGVGGSLLVLTVAMRWWHRRGAEAASAGLRSGAVPTVAALAVCRFAPSCPPDVALGLCVGVGLVSGALVGRTAIQRSAKPWQHWTAAALVAALTAALGCIGLGVGTAAGAAIAIALGTAVVSVVSREVPV
jgi:hypothetical protein